MHICIRLSSAYVLHCMRIQTTCSCIIVSCVCLCIYNMQVYSYHITHVYIQVLLLGDMVAKGPHSAEVVKMVRDIRAVSVRGNHGVYAHVYAYI